MNENGFIGCDNHSFVIVDRLESGSVYYFKKRKNEMLMKSNKLLWINGIVGILGGLLIIYASSNRWHWEIINLVPKLIENPGWGKVVILTSWLLLGLSIVGMYHYSNDPRVNKTSHELLFCASIMGFISFLFTFSGLLSIISGILYLLDLSKFKNDEKVD